MLAAMRLKQQILTSSSLYDSLKSLFGNFKRLSTRKEIMRIGYQGVAGSNAETAAINIANKMGFENVEFIPETSVLYH